MSVSVRSCCANVTLATAVAITAAAVCPAAQSLGHHEVKVTYPLVGFPAVTLAGLETVFAAVDSASAQPDLAGFNSPADTPQAVAQAAATTPGDALYDAVREVAFWTGLALLPAWWIAFPVTFPIGFLVGQHILFPAPPDYRDALGFRNLGLMLCAVALPPLLVVELFPARVSSTDTATTPAPSAARTSAASAADFTDPAIETADEPAMGSDEAAGEDISAAVPDSKRSAEPAAAVPPSTETVEESLAAGAAIDEQAAVASVSRGNAAASRRAAEDKQSHEHSTATARERKIRAAADSPTATGRTSPNAAGLSSSSDGADPR